MSRIAPALAIAPAHALMRAKILCTLCNINILTLIFKAFETISDFKKEILVVPKDEDALEATEDLAERRRDQLVTIFSTIAYCDCDKS